MKIINTYDYRNALAVLNNNHRNEYAELKNVLKNPAFILQFVQGRDNTCSKQIQRRVKNLYPNWNLEFPNYSLPDLKYDMHKNRLPVEIEISYKRSIFADFYKFSIDHMNNNIHAAIFITTNNPMDFGHNWHCSYNYICNSLNNFGQIYQVPTLVIGIEP